MQWSLCFVFWVLCVVGLELTSNHSLTRFFSFVFCLWLSVISLLAANEFEALATLILVVYSAVALFFFLIYLLVKTSDSTAMGFKDDSQFFYWSLLVQVACYSLGAVLFANVGIVDSSVNTTPTWVYVTELVELGELSVLVLHWLFFKFFVIETFWLNFYILLGLVASLFIFYLWRLLGLTRSSLSKTEMASLSHLSTRGVLARIHQVSKFRRQIRRKNTGFLRHR